MLSVKTIVMIILISLGCGGVFWTLSSVIISQVLHSGTFLEQFFQPDTHHLWMRVPVVIISVPIVTIIVLLGRKTAEVESSLRGLVMSSPVGVYVIQGRKFQQVNPAFQRDTGYSENELLGMDSLELVMPEDRDMVRENAVKMLKGQHLQSYEYRGINKIGDIIWVLEAVAPIKYKGKRATIGTYVEITVRKQAEEKVEELYGREKELRQSLESEMKRRMEFNRALVHELKTPIVPIVAASELLADEIHEEKLQTMVGSIQRGAWAISRRIDTLLDVARGELGMFILKSEEVDMVKLLNQVAKDMSAAASTQGLSFDIEVPSSLPSVWADKTRLEQVIMNILTNAFKFTPQGGTVALRGKEKDETLMVEVQDTGPGIAKENWQRVFEAYYRVESDRQHRTGLGLGLALCKIIIEAHNGEIWVESKEGIGSTFGFSLPLRATDAK